MNLARVFHNSESTARAAEVIFDRDEPVGRPTDMVLPVRHWFRCKQRASQTSALQLARPVDRTGQSSAQ